jgi:hypothetical protein
VAHIGRNLTKGCPSIINFEEASEMKSSNIEKGNQATFNMYPEIVPIAMNKDDRYSHLLPVKLWVLYFSLKWLELVIGTAQTILGMTLDTNLMTVGITPQYHQQVVLARITKR